MEKVQLLHESQEAVIKWSNDYSWILSEAKYKSIHGEEFKIITLKQMLQRLPITLAQVNAGNTSENLLIVIRQIIYSLYRAKKLLKIYMII